jgi:hypothetical protein
MSSLNNVTLYWRHIIKPCKLCGFCPYGRLVEEYPFTDSEQMSCEVFGHDCPAYYLSEPFVDTGGISKIEYDRHNKELEETTQNLINGCRNAKE